MSNDHFRTKGLKTRINIRLLQRIALVSAVFALLLSVMIIVNYLQLKRADPLNTATLNALVKQLQSQPGNEELRQEIRELDLLARKAFFTNQWQLKTGGLLLVCSVLIIIICLQSIEYFQKKIPELPKDDRGNIFAIRSLSRKWIAGTGIFLLITALILAYLSHRESGGGLLVAGEEGLTMADSLHPGAVAVTASREAGGEPGKAVSDSISSGEKDQTGFPSETELRANFPSFRGVGGNGIAYQKNIPVNWDGKSGKNIRWKTAIPLPGYNSPVIWKDRIFLAGANDKSREVYCVDIHSGKILWASRLNKINGSPAEVPKVNIETGFCAPSLCTDGRRVYAIFANGDIAALDFEGVVKWSKNLGLPKNHYGHSSSLNLFQDKVIIQYDQGGSANVMALSGLTGDLAWKTSRNVRISWASPVVISTGKRTEVILAADPYVASYDARTGAELWKIDCISGEVGPSLAYADGVVFSVNEYSKLSAIQIGESPKLLWEDTEYLSDVPSPVATSQLLFLPTSYGTMVCYEAKTGKKLWEKEFGTKTYSSPILVEGKIYLLDSKGIMHIFKADNTYISVAEPALGEGSFCTPAFSDGLIILRGNKNLYCISREK